MDTCAIRVAKQNLNNKNKAPATPETAKEIDALVAVETTEEQRQAAALQARKILKKAKENKPPRTKTIKAAAWGLAMSVEPGPSSWRNSDILDVVKQQGGPTTMQRWAGLWVRGEIPEKMADLWSAAIIAPLDDGEKKKPPDGELVEPWPDPPPRKLRPIAISEVLVETTVLDEEITAILTRAEPENLGLGTLDAAAVIVRTLRAWAVQMKQRALEACSGAQAVRLPQGREEEQMDKHANDEVQLPQDAEVILPIDLENADGRADRSNCLAAAAPVAKRIAATSATQWQGEGTLYWQRVEGRWQLARSTRGGWQGSRAMQCMFVLGLER